MRRGDTIDESDAETQAPPEPADDDLTKLPAGWGSDLAQRHELMSSSARPSLHLACAISETWPCHPGSWTATST